MAGMIDYIKQMKMVDERGIRDVSVEEKKGGLVLKENGMVQASMMYDKMTGRDSVKLTEQTRLLGAAQAIKEILESDLSDKTVVDKINKVRKIVASV